ncbi:hypothetical protein BLNAU_8155 [Blattamonas nauphoetae]|uniref:Uncharacterized protein n=1 Tax=Blattamonas nauphoetae TaxID=2049346 RepID=A0ABQ9XZI0_9EUKA|nr:hypothetical protein BLNAU_8155 [Blattamonas nauphoetae]
MLYAPQNSFNFHYRHTTMERASAIRNRNSVWHNKYAEWCGVLKSLKDQKIIIEMTDDLNDTPIPMPFDFDEELEAEYETGLEPNQPFTFRVHFLLEENGNPKTSICSFNVGTCDKSLTFNRYVSCFIRDGGNPEIMMSRMMEGENVSLVGVLIESQSIGTGKYSTKLRAKPVQTEYYRGMSDREFTFWLERNPPNTEVKTSVSNAKTNSTYEFVAKIVIDDEKKSVDYVLQVLDPIEGSYEQFTKLDTISELEAKIAAEIQKGQVRAAPPQLPTGPTQATGPSQNQFMRIVPPTICGSDTTFTDSISTAMPPNMTVAASQNGIEMFVKLTGSVSPSCESFNVRLPSRPSASNTARCPSLLPTHADSRFAPFTFRLTNRQV